MNLTARNKRNIIVNVQPNKLRRNVQDIKTNTKRPFRSIVCVIPYKRCYFQVDDPVVVCDAAAAAVIYCLLFLLPSSSYFSR